MATVLLNNFFFQDKWLFLKSSEMPGNGFLGRFFGLEILHVSPGNFYVSDNILPHITKQHTPPHPIVVFFSSTTIL